MPKTYLADPSPHASLAETLFGGKSAIIGRCRLQGPGPDMCTIDPLLRLIEHRDQPRSGLAQVEAARLRSCSGPKMEMESAHVEIPTLNCGLPVSPEMSTNGTCLYERSI